MKEKIACAGRIAAPSSAVRSSRMSNVSAAEPSTRKPASMKAEPNTV